MVTMGLPEKLLQRLEDEGELDTYEFATLINEDHQKIIGAVKCLQALDGVITAEPRSFVKWVLTEEGKHVTQAGSHEALAYGAIPAEGILKDELSKIVPPTVHSVGLSKAMAHGWIMVDKNSGKPVLRRKVENIKDTVKEHLISFASNPNCIDAKVKNEYKKRKLIQEVTTKSFTLGKGVNFSLSISKPETDLTPEMIASGSWKNLTFKPYNFDARGVPPTCGALHPLLKVRAEFRQIFLEMGFSEMPTNNYVESSFWNFDALFQPQQHPARDAHDTFFVAEPKECKTFPMSYLEKVKQVHSSGGFGSQGYGYDWKIEEAQKNLLRTHTTAVSAKMLYKLAQDGFCPAKYFSIDRVFRNETLDATHLAEFHQVEGVVADYKLSLGDLIGVLSEFFSKLGLEKLTFKPAYNPYTEPSMEIFSFHPGLNKFIEVGNSGIFRPEMLLPMGLPEDVNVIAWGLSLERPTMIKYGINNIRTLVGPKVDLEMVHESPICRLDKMEQSQESSMAELLDRLDNIMVHLQKINCKLQDVKRKVKDLEVNNGDMGMEIVITANPQWPPLAVFALLKQLSHQINGSVHVHSSLPSVAPELNVLVENIFNNSVGLKQLDVTFIWRGDCKVPMIKADSHITSLIGEVNIARYLAYWCEQEDKSRVLYKRGDTIMSVKIDNWLDLLHGSVLYGNDKKRCVALKKLESVLKKHSWLVDTQPTLADLCWWSGLKTLKIPSLSTTLQQWLAKCNEHKMFAVQQN